LFLDVGYRPETEDVFLTVKVGADPRALVLPFAHVH
jgi:hypothetical protein